MVFKNRIEAGRQLAKALAQYKGKDTVVFVLPNGGVVVGAEAAEYLGAPLELIISSKIGHPMATPFAIGAVTETGAPVWNRSELGYTDEAWRKHQVRHARAEAKRHRIRLQGGQYHLSVHEKTAIVVADGTITGLAVIAALRDVVKRRPKFVVVAVPVTSKEAAGKFVSYADETVALHIPRSFFGSVGTYYEDFPPITDEEVRGLLNAYRNIPEDKPLDLPALNAILATIKWYPATARQLAGQAKRLHAPANVVSFFESIPKDIEFEDKVDVMRRSDEVEVLMEEETDQPAEHLRSYDV